MLLLKKVIYYITDHGRGHATRSVAIIRELLKMKIDVIVRNSNVVNFLEKSIPDVKILSGITDVGPVIKKDGISIDKAKTESVVGKWLDNIKNFAEEEYQKIIKYSPDLIISDISAMPFLVSKKMNKKSIGISNFSWYDVLDCISHTQHEILKESYDNADLVIQLPLGTSMDHFKRKTKVGYVCRYPTMTKEEARKKIGLKPQEFGIFVALGNSEDEISSNVTGNIKLISTGTRIRNKANLISMDDWIEGQDLVSASDFVICKCGYGIVSECITNGIPFMYISDDEHKEQKAMSDALRQMGLNNRITMNDLNNMKLDQDTLQNKVKFEKQNIDTISVVNQIKEMLNS